MRACRQTCILFPCHLFLVSRSTLLAFPSSFLRMSADTIAIDLDDSSRSSDVSFRTAIGGDVTSSPRPARISLPPPVDSVETPARSPTSHRRTSSLFTSTPDSPSDDGIMLDFPGYESPWPEDQVRAEMRNERRYRILLQHEFHPSRKLKLVSC